MTAREKFEAVARRQKIARAKEERAKRARVSARTGPRIDAPKLGPDEFILRDSREAVGMAVNSVQRLAARGRIKMRKVGTWAIIDKPSVLAHLEASKIEHRDRMEKARTARLTRLAMERERMEVGE